MKKILSFLLALSMFSILFASSSVVGGDASAYGAEAIIRVGLYYGNDALPAANLANEIGSGYIFGWIDNTDYFTEVGYTFEEKITVIKDKNLYLKNSVYYDSLPPAGSDTIGAFHVQSAAPLYNYDEAYFIASDLKRTGVQAFPAYVSGEWYVRAGSFTSLDAANAARAQVGLPDGTAVGGSQTCYTVVVTSTGEFLFEFDTSGASYLAINPTGAPQPVTWFKGYKYHGMFEYRRNNGNDITVIGVLPVGDYAKGVVPYESNPKWNIEALKAQAICASSYAIYSAGRHASMGFDICNTTCCQVYRGLNSATGNSNAACDAVHGLALYSEGKICSTVYHSSNGGSTEAAKNVWTTDYSYLQAVPDTFEDLDSANYGRWSYTYTGEEIAWVLNQKGYSIGTVTKAYIEEFTPAGNVFRVSFEDARGTYHSFTKERARSILGSDTLKKYTHSQRYTISTGGINLFVNSAQSQISADKGTLVISGDGKIGSLASDERVYIQSSIGVTSVDSKARQGVFTVSGTGWGHNVGLSQWGAKGRADAGWSYQQILEYYFTGARVIPIPLDW